MSGGLSLLLCYRCYPILAPLSCYGVVALPLVALIGPWLPQSPSPTKLLDLAADLLPLELKAESCANVDKDTTGQHKSHLFDLHCKICTGEPRIGPDILALSMNCEFLLLCRALACPAHKGLQDTIIKQHGQNKNQK